MFFVSDALLDQILTDDIPYGDATTALLGIEKVPGIVRCRPKAETTIAGVALAERLFTRVGLQTTCFHEEGDTVDAGTVILEGRGPAGAIHAVYKTAQNILEYASGIATRTHQMVQEAKAGNAACRVAVTRKHFPGTKTLSLYAAMAGGAVVHRMGLSESVLVFDQHRVFIQCEKFSTEALSEFVSQAKRKFPQLIISAAGGLNAANARAYAQTGVDFLVTTWPYFGKPADVKMQILAEDS